MGGIIVKPDLSAVIDTNDGIVTASSETTNQQPSSKGRTIDPLFYRLIDRINVVSVNYPRTVLLQEVRAVGIYEDSATRCHTKDSRHARHDIMYYTTCLLTLLLYRSIRDHDLIS